MISPKNLLLLLSISSFSFAMQRERTVPKSQAMPRSNNQLDPYDCGYLDKMPAPDAALAKLAIEVAPVEIQSLTHHLATDGIYASCKPQNLLLYGHSGTGKSTLAQAIAIESGHPYSFVNCCWLGNEIEDSASDNLHRIVNYALEQKQKPYIIILNDMVGFLKSERIEDEAFTLARLLDEYKDHDGIYFIGVVPPPHAITPLVAKLFDKRTLSLPNQEAREKALAYNMKEFSKEVPFTCSPESLHRISLKTDGYSFFCLQGLQKHAAGQAFLRTIKNNPSATHLEPTTEKDLEEGFLYSQKKLKEIGLLPKTATMHKNILIAQLQQGLRQ